MALLGADILALPTNCPEGRGKIVKHVINTRVCEHRVHLVAAANGFDELVLPDHNQLSREKAY
ncbi:hypothetical protein ACFLUW_00710 [Chloroflexota bacterium]